MKKYSIYLLTGIFSVLLCVSVLNWIINPYDIFLSPSITGFNDYKSEVERHTRLSKIYQVEKILPDIVLLASSRGLVVKDKHFSENGLVGLNLSLPSSSTYELLRVLQHALAMHPLKKVILALDEEFTDTVQPNFSEGRLAVNYDGTVNDDKWKQAWRDVLFSLLSADGLSSSIRTIRKQKYSPDSPEFEKHNSERIFKAGGHRQMFRTMEASAFSGHEKIYDDCMNVVTDSNNIKEDGQIHFQKIVELAYENNIELYIYISPVHARYYEAKCMLGKWHEIENMKRKIVSIVEESAKTFGYQSYPIWDFSGYNSVTSEPVPELGDRTSRMAWYWEGSHYSYKTAEIIFDKLFGGTEGPDDFGVQLTSGNIEQHLNVIRKQRETYLKAHINEADELRSIFEGVRLGK